MPGEQSIQRSSSMAEPYFVPQLVKTRAFTPMTKTYIIKIWAKHLRKKDLIEKVWTFLHNHGIGVKATHLGIHRRFLYIFMRLGHNKNGDFPKRPPGQKLT